MKACNLLDIGETHRWPRVIQISFAPVMVLFILFLLSACAPRTVQDRPVTVRVPVPVPCVTDWPQSPDPLPDRSHWAQMDARQKAAAIGKCALDHKGYSEQVEAATGGCR